jgi:DNA-directed RNA polymerase I, II, and III subunit RPABC1
MAAPVLEGFRYDIFRARRTVLEMLQDRNYLIEAADITLSEQEFADAYAGAETTRAGFLDIHAEKEGGLTILTQRRTDPTDQIYVFWPKEPKVGVIKIKRCERPQRVWAGKMDVAAPLWPEAC